MSRLLPALALTAALTLTSATPAAAQGSGESGWAEIFSPERRRGRRMTQLGLRKLTHAMGRLRPELGDEPRWLVLEEALLRFERARRYLPDEPALAFYTAYALTRWERGTVEGGTEYRAEEAIAAWHRLRELAPGFMPERVAYELAMLHMRRQEFHEARDAYRAALANTAIEPVELFHRFYIPAPTEESLGLLYGPLALDNIEANLAEVLMLTGEVREAIGYYRSAHDATSSPYSRTLAQWGLALAHDRAGDHAEALRWAARAMREDPIAADPRFGAAVARHGSFAILHIEGVYFEPRYEIHAYEALGHEARATVSIDADPSHLPDALRSWRLFLTEGGVASRFATLARAHIDRLEDPTPRDRP